jgi:hypothetical protein
MSEQINTLVIRPELYTDDYDYLVLQIVIDDQPVADFRDYATDLRQLIESVDRDGEFFILTCWCGVPECSGIYRGVQVKQEADQVIWEVKEPETLPRFVFTKKQYRWAVDEGIKQAKDLVAYMQTDDAVLHIVPDINEHFLVHRKREKHK